MLTMQGKYNQVMDRIQNAEIYFQTKFEGDSEEGRNWAIDTFVKLMQEFESLFKQLRSCSSTPELQFGFNDSSMTLQLDIEEEVYDMIERLDIIKADGWKVDRMEYLRQSKKILVRLVRA